MRSLPFWTTILCVACSSAPQSRTGPPGGGVDPATISPTELSMDANPRDRSREAPPQASKPPPTSGGGGTNVDDLAPTPGAGSSGAAKGASFKITAEHCKEMGRKFRQLTIDGGGSRGDADKVEKEIASKCTKEQVGTEVTQSEYDCILGAKAMLDVASCK